MLHIAIGLSFLHREDVLHGDLKTVSLFALRQVVFAQGLSELWKSNIIVQNDVAILVDYGLQPCAESQETCPQSVYDTFKAPEILKYSADHIKCATTESDIYAMGTVYSEVRYPFSVP